MKKQYSPSVETRTKFSEHNLDIRVSSDGDLPRIIELKQRIFAELCPNLVRWYQKHPEVFAQEFYGPQGQDSAKRVFYSVTANTGLAIIGCGGLTQKDPQGAPAVGEIADIYLDQEFRGRGLGKILVSDLIGKAKKIGFEKLFLTTRKEFVAATHLYQTLGFQQVKNNKYHSANSTAWELQL